MIEYAIVKTRKILIQLFGLKSVKKFYEVFTITRIDLRFDCEGIPLDCFIVNANTATTYHYIRDKSGQLVYIRFGGPKNDQFVLYPKDKEINYRTDKRGISRIHLCEPSFGYTPLIRLEFRLKNRTQLWKLIDISSPFEKFELLDPSIMAHALIHPFFASAVRELGMKAALSILNNKDRKKYKDILGEYVVDLDHLTIWSNIQKLLKMFGALKHKKSFDEFINSKSKKPLKKGINI